MDDEARRQLIRNRLKQQHGGKKEIAAKYQSKYPDSAQREYMRLVDQYMDVEKQVILRYLPELKKILWEDQQYHVDASGNDKKRKTRRFAILEGILSQLKDLFERMLKEMESTFGLFGLKKMLEGVAALDHKLTVREWKKTVNKTLGLNLLEDYYSGGFYQDMLDKWVSDNVDLIRTIPHESLGKMKEIVYQAYMDGKPTTSIVKEIQRQYGRDKRHARLIARDQIAKLNAAITQHQQTDAGISRYRWSDSRDKRVRNSHRKLNGRIFRWDDPPETDAGRRCHPGQDYQCRCCALAIFDLDSIDLPI